MSIATKSMLLTGEKAPENSIPSFSFLSLCVNKCHRKNVKSDKLVFLAAAQPVTKSSAVEFILANTTFQRAKERSGTQYSVLVSYSYWAMSLVSGCELSSSSTFSKRHIPPSFISRGQYLFAAEKNEKRKKNYTSAPLFTGVVKSVISCSSNKERAEQIL